MHYIVAIMHAFLCRLSPASRLCGRETHKTASVMRFASLDARVVSSAAIDQRPTMLSTSVEPNRNLSRCYCKDDIPIQLETTICEVPSIRTL